MAEDEASRGAMQETPAGGAAAVDPASVLRRPMVQSLLLQAATIDRETGCLTAAYLAYRAREEIERRQRYGGRLSLLLIGADPVDEVETARSSPSLPARAAAMVRSRLRGTDLIGRWDTDELVALLPGTGLAGASRLGRRILAGGVPAAVGPAPVPTPAALLSIGVATWLGGGETLATLVQRARGGLAEARAGGGGRVGVS